jgi:hypothetical protein
MDLPTSSADQLPGLSKLAMRFDPVPRSQIAPRSLGSIGQTRSNHWPR